VLHDHDVNRLLQIEELRRRAIALHKDAAYWRSQGRRRMAAEVESVARFTSRLADELARQLETSRLVFDHRPIRRPTRD
jgi:hypothetical protein